MRLRLWTARFWRLTFGRSRCSFGYRTVLLRRVTLTANVFGFTRSYAFAAPWIAPSRAHAAPHAHTHYTRAHALPLPLLLLRLCFARHHVLPPWFAFARVLRLRRSRWPTLRSFFACRRGSSALLRARCHRLTHPYLIQHSRFRTFGFGPPAMRTALVLAAAALTTRRPRTAGSPARMPPGRCCVTFYRDWFVRCGSVRWTRAVVRAR